MFSDLIFFVALQCNVYIRKLKLKTGV